MRRVYCLLAVCLLVMSLAGHAAVAVIVHPANYDMLNEVQLRNLFLGKSKTFPSGTEVTVLELGQGNAVRAEFLQKVLRRSEANLNAYWARMLFSSQGRPPQVMQNAQQMISAVAADKSAIGYVAPEDVNPALVRVILVID